MIVAMLPTLATTVRMNTAWSNLVRPDPMRRSIFSVAGYCALKSPHADRVGSG
jgi:hypothetical protein